MRTVLYIEDDETNRQLVQFIFSRREDLGLIAADTGFAGIQMAIQHQPDMILLDLSLPDIDGFNVFKQLQSHNSTNHIPVIALSGNNTEEDVQKGMDAGLQGYLSKPINVVELYAVIDKTISSAE
jgi:CheY-like chemotaxis protein